MQHVHTKIQFNSNMQRRYHHHQWSSNVDFRDTHTHTQLPSCLINMFVQSKTKFECNQIRVLFIINIKFGRKRSRSRRRKGQKFSQLMRVLNCDYNYDFTKQKKNKKNIRRYVFLVNVCAMCARIADIFLPSNFLVVSSCIVYYLMLNKCSILDNYTSIFENSINAI